VVPVVLVKVVLHAAAAVLVTVVLHAAVLVAAVLVKVVLHAAVLVRRMMTCQQLQGRPTSCSAYGQCTNVRAMTSFAWMDATLTLVVENEQLRVDLRVLQA